MRWVWGSDSLGVVRRRVNQLPSDPAGLILAPSTPFTAGPRCSRLDLAAVRVGVGGCGITLPGVIFSSRVVEPIAAIRTGIADMAVH